MIVSCRMKLEELLDQQIGTCLIRECVSFENDLRALKYEKEYDIPD